MNRRALAAPPYVESTDGGATWTLVTVTHLWCGHPRWGTRVNRLDGLTLEGAAGLMAKLGYDLTIDPATVKL